MSAKPEVWLRGPLDGVPPLLQPVAHCLLQAREELEALLQDFPEQLLWERPAGLASPGFHLKHITGVLDRLFTYARGEQLSAVQLEYLSNEGESNISLDKLTPLLKGQVEVAISQLMTTDEAILTQKRDVGRAKLPSTVIGLYVHAAEHTMRHTGQLLVTVKVLKEDMAKS